MMIKILNKCKDLYSHLKCCHGEGGFCNCYNCLRNGFYGGNDTYSCIKKLSYYVMNYGPIYSSEIYHFLTFTNIIEENFENDLRIMSLGCGFGPDYIALRKYIKDNDVDIELKYYGFDKENRWKKITSGIYTNLPNEKDLLEGFSLKDYDIIFLNKIYSTLKSINKHNEFMALLVRAIKNTMPSGAMIVFNDVNHYSMGRDDFHNTMRGLTEVEIDGKYFFNIDGAYTGDYTEIPHLANVYSIPDDLPVSPKTLVNKTIFFVYRKI